MTARSIAGIVSLLTVSQLSLFAQTGNLSVGLNSLSFSAATSSTTSLSQTVGVSSTGAPLNFSTNIQYLSNTEGWLSVSPTSGVTPANLIVFVNAAGLPNGNYAAQVVVNAGVTQSKSVTVFLSVSPTGGAGAFTANPTSVTLTAQSGFATSQAVSVSAANNSVLPFSLFTGTANGGSWLSTNASSTSTPATVTIIANASNLAAGTYTGTVTISPASGGQASSIPVTLTVTANGTGTSPGLSVNPTSLIFNYQINGAAPASQMVAITNTVGSVTYTATSNVTWLGLVSNSGTNINSVSGLTGTSLTVIPNPTGFAAGSYPATISISAPGFTGQVITVTLNVTGSGTGTGGMTTGLVASPSVISFTSPVGGSFLSLPVSVTNNGALVADFNTSVNSQNNWLRAEQQEVGQMAVGAIPGSLPIGSYSGTVTVTAAGATTSVTANLSIVAGSGTGTVTSGGPITVSPQSLTFQGQVGSTVLPQSISLNTTGGTSVNFTASASSTPQFLSITPLGGTAPTSISVTPTLAGLAAGTYMGSVMITNRSTNTSQSVSVTLILSGTSTGGNGLTASPASLTFSQAPGGTPPPAQTTKVSLGSGSPTITATSNTSWLLVTPSSGSSPLTLSVSVNGASLTAGAYQGGIVVTSGSSSTTIPVNLNIAVSATSITVTPNSLTFNSQTGGTAPAAQTVSVGATGASSSFTTSVQATGGSWLSATSSGATTPATLSVSVNPTGLAPGIYPGTVTVTGPSSNQTVNVTLNISSQATPAIRIALNAASGQPGLIAPGEILALQGTNMGPLTGVTAAPTSAGTFNTALSGVQVMFDGVPAPLLFVRNDQINAIAPYAIFGKTSTQITVQYSGSTSDPLGLRVTDAAPGVFTVDSSGKGAGAIVNQDGTINGPTHPAASGTIVSIYATGEGQTNPAGQDGRVISTDLRVSLLPVSVRIGGVAATVTYAGSAPGLVSGAFQVNVRIPSGVGSGPVPLDLQVGTAVSPSGVTVSIAPPDPTTGQPFQR
jgi:uncharacterized protein (TIGR03437 family)